MKNPRELIGKALKTLDRLEQEHDRIRSSVFDCDQKSRHVPAYCHDLAVSGHTYKRFESLQIHLAGLMCLSAI